MTGSFERNSPPNPLDRYLITEGCFSSMPNMASLPRMFATGDLQDHVNRQAITSVGIGTGCMAVLNEQRLLDHTNGTLRTYHSTCTGWGPARRRSE